MKTPLLLILLFFTLHANSQTVFGYWYGHANVKTVSSANNYLVELVLQPEKGYVKGLLNYYFKNTYRSIQVKGNYDEKTRILSLYNIPLTYHGSISTMEVDCMMNLHGNLRVAKAGSRLTGDFTSLPEYRFICTPLSFDLSLNADISKKDSVLKVIREFKETYQVWKPGATDTLISATIIPRKVTNFVIERQFTERQDSIANEITVASDSVSVDFYDNGEIDGDSISIFYNKKLIAFNQKLSSGAVHFDIVLDSSKAYNEITMFADNLGSIPPNTALMVVDDGINKYDIRLSSSLEKNATIRIKRKPTK